jgi:hypothetical protein
MKWHTFLAVLALGAPVVGAACAAGPAPQPAPAYGPPSHTGPAYGPAAHAPGGTGPAHDPGPHGGTAPANGYGPGDGDVPWWTDCWPYHPCNSEAFSRSSCLHRYACPDDYCPKPYPELCWPPYPPFYTCGQPGHDCPRHPHTQGAPPPPGSARLIDIILGGAP